MFLETPYTTKADTTVLKVPERLLLSDPFPYYNIVLCESIEIQLLKRISLYYLLI